MTDTGDLYTETEVAELLTVAVLKARARDREELAGLRAALRVAELGGLSAAVVRKAMESQPTEPTPPASQPDDDSDPDDTDVYDSPEAELLDAALVLAEEGHATGEDVQGGLDALYELIDDPDELDRIAGGDTFEKAWDESKHPRGKNGHFISRDAIADAKSDPAKAAKLRAEVKPADKDKLEDALSGKTDLGTTAKRQKRDLTADKRQKKQADRRTAMDLVYKIRDAHASGKAVGADDLHALIPHLSTLTGEELRDVRTQLFRLGATFNGERRVSDRAKNLTDWARKQALDARMKEQGFGDEEAAAAKQVVGAANPVSPEPVAAPEPAKPAEPQPQPATAPQAASKPARAPKAPADAAQIADTLAQMRQQAVADVDTDYRTQANELVGKLGLAELTRVWQAMGRPGKPKNANEARATLVDAVMADRAAMLRADVGPRPVQKPTAPATPPAATALAKRPLADKQHLEKVAAAAPDQTTRDYLENAAHNAPGDRQTLHPADRRHQTVERLAAEHRNALAAGHTGAAGHLAKVIGEYGGKLEGAAPGETTPFDGSLYDSAERPGEGTLWTGQPARVLRQPILGPDGRVAVRGEMEPAGTAAPQPPDPTSSGDPSYRDVSAQVRSDPNANDWERTGADRLDLLTGHLGDGATMRPSAIHDAHEAMQSYAQRHAGHLDNRIGRAVDAAGRAVLERSGEQGRAELERKYAFPLRQIRGLVQQGKTADADKVARTAKLPPQVLEFLGVSPTSAQPRTPRGTGRADDAAPTEEEIAAASRPHVPKPSAPVPVPAKAPRTTVPVNEKEVADRLTAMREDAVRDLKTDFRSQANEIVGGLSLPALNRIWNAMGRPGKLKTPQAARDAIVDSVMANRAAFLRSQA